MPHVGGVVGVALRLDDDYVAGTVDGEHSVEDGQPRFARRVKGDDLTSPEIGSALRCQDGNIPWL